MILHKKRNLLENFEMKSSSEKKRKIPKMNRKVLVQMCGNIYLSTEQEFPFLWPAENVPICRQTRVLGGTQTNAAEASAIIGDY